MERPNQEPSDAAAEVRKLRLFFSGLLIIGLIVFGIYKLNEKLNERAERIAECRSEAFLSGVGWDTPEDDAARADLCR